MPSMLTASEQPLSALSLSQPCRINLEKNTRLSPGGKMPAKSVWFVTLKDKKPISRHEIQYSFNPPVTWSISSSGPGPTASTYIISVLMKIEAHLNDPRRH